MVHGANIQDSDGAERVIRAMRGLFPWIETVFADQAYAGPRVSRAAGRKVEIITRPKGTLGFTVLPKRLRRRANPRLALTQSSSR